MKPIILIPLLAMLCGCEDRTAIKWHTNEEAAKLAQRVDPLKPLPSIESLMPKFEIRSNSPTDFRVAFKSYEQTNWSVVSVVFQSRLDAEMTLALVKFRLAEKIEFAKSIQDRLTK